MTKIDLTLDLPDRVAEEARDAGLLSPRAVTRLLRAEIRRQAAGRLLAGANRAIERGSTAMSMAAIRREVDAVRKNRRESDTRTAG
jgi:post-segregation antitoxin (ccd killing protein)